MENQTHTVLGASGAIGRAVINELKARNLTIRAVERKPKLQGVVSVSADLLIEKEAIDAIKDSAYVYLCVGLPYSSKLWASDWPLLMKNVITACEKAKARLIFLDNVYMYGPAPLPIPFDEGTKQKPTTKKGVVRKQTADLLLKAIAEKRIEAVIGRSADFYGEHAVNTHFYNSFLQNLLIGKAPQVFGPLDVPHTNAYTGDNGRALVMLALDHSTYGQVWHLPVGKAITFTEANAIMNKVVGTNLTISYVPKFIRFMLGLFIPPVGELEEMLYQFQSRYEMSFEKFKKHFPDFKVTPYEEGIKKMAESFKK